MSFLDLDERLVEIAERADLVYSPLVDVKEYPEDVDVCLVEGAVASEADLEKIRRVRERTGRWSPSATARSPSNVPGMRNPIGPQPLLDRAYLENVTLNPRLPHRSCPGCCRQRCRCTPSSTVDVFLPGCPPSADLIYAALDDLLAGRRPGPVAPGPVRPVGAAG